MKKKCSVIYQVKIGDIFDGITGRCEFRHKVFPELYFHSKWVNMRRDCGHSYTLWDPSVKVKKALNNHYHPKKLKEHPFSFTQLKYLEVSIVIVPSLSWGNWEPGQVKVYLRPHNETSPKYYWNSFPPKSSLFLLTPTSQNHKYCQTGLRHCKGHILYVQWCRMFTVQVHWSRLYLVLSLRHVLEWGYVCSEENVAFSKWVFYQKHHVGYQLVLEGAWRKGDEMKEGCQESSQPCLWVPTAMLLFFDEWGWAGRRHI